MDSTSIAYSGRVPETSQIFVFDTTTLPAEVMEMPCRLPLLSVHPSIITLHCYPVKN